MSGSDFDTECAAAGLILHPDDRPLVEALWAENRARRDALRSEAFDPDEAPFSPPPAALDGPADPFVPPPASGDPLHWATAAELSGRLARRELTSRDLTEACLARISAYDPALRAFETVDADGALAAADAADAAFARGEVAGPLQGVPVACKAAVAAAGLPWTAGSAARADVVAGADAALLANLRAAGAVFLGTTRMHEFGAGMATAEGPRATGRNPWAPDRIPGGSSSGSAVAVAAGMVPGAVGTDSAGSIRMPAANCGIVGFKPSFGLVPTAGVYPYAWSLDTAGILARDVTDAALWTEAMVGPQATGRLAGTPGAGLKGRRIGVPRAFLWDRDDIRADVRAACEGVLEALAAAGAELVEVTVPSLPWIDAIYCTLMAETYALHGAALGRDRRHAGDWFRAHALTGALFTAADIHAAHRMRGRLADEFAQVFHGVEALVLPGQAVPATPFSGSFAKALTQPRSQFMRPFNLTGLPAIALPCGWSEEGLPLSINLAGPAGGDARLLGIARAVEPVLDLPVRRPDDASWQAA